MQVDDNQNPISLWGDGYRGDDATACTNADEEDLEDLAVPFDAAEQQRSVENVGVTVHSKEAADTKSNAQLGSDSVGHTDSAHFLPGQASVWVKTWGCGHNVSDGEYMAGLLSSHGYSVLFEDARKDDADLWLLNSCTVKGPSEMSFINDIKRGQDKGKKVVVAGCVPQASGTVGGSIGRGKGKGREWDGLSVVGVQQIDRVVEVVEETLKGNVIRLTKEKKMEVEKDTDDIGSSSTKKRKAGGAKLDLPKVRRNPYVEIIPINTGCLNQCTYCKTKHARGDLGSYAPQEIWDRVESVIQEGVKEIWLTSEDTGAYGRDIGASIVDLLWGIVKILERYPKIGTTLRVGMTNPPYILEHLDEMVKILSHPRVFSFLHVPVQSGSNSVLDAMRRQYTAEEFSEIVDTLRTRVGPSGCTVATDIICGFPTETDADFEDTMSLLRKHNFTVLHISQFYSRPGTPAALLPRLPSEIVKARSRVVSTFFNALDPNMGLEGTRVRALVTELSSDGQYYVGHDKLYRQVLVPRHERFLGRWLEVEVVRTGKFFLEGKFVGFVNGFEGGLLCEDEVDALDLEDKAIAGTDADSGNGETVGGSRPGKGMVVKRRKAPKLVNVAGKIVNLGNEAQSVASQSMESGESVDDGTVLSVPGSFQKQQLQARLDDEARQNDVREKPKESGMHAWLSSGAFVGAGLAAVLYGGIRLLQLKRLDTSSRLLIAPSMILVGGAGLTVSGIWESFFSRNK
ncbi:hypothetical protein BC830DRAFT_1087817 [Chytriomyces sp. MP71]|nr:hypothetical protein BC830DRAFT_1087817 [Chytriomyces sp. MP71]